MHWLYEDVDLAPYLLAGKNVIAVVVWHWGEHKPVARHSYQSGFLLRGVTADEAIIDTGTSLWKVTANRAYGALPVTREQGSFPYNAGGWQWVPRSIPLMDEHPIRFKSVRRTHGVTTDGKFLDDNGTLVIPPKRPPPYYWISRI